MAKPKKQHPYPEQLYVYIFDMDGDNPIYGVAHSIDDIPEDEIGYLIGVYRLDGVSELKIEKRLILRGTRV